MNRQAILMLLAGAALGAAATATVTVKGAEELRGAPAPKQAGPDDPGSTALLPLDGLVVDIERKHGGVVTEIELERRPWGDHYEMELTDGSLREWDIVVDARSGEMLRESRDFD
jgi:uncharacterized membrane protein YkoI